MSQRFLTRTIAVLIGAGLMLAAGTASASPPHSGGQGGKHADHRGHGHVQPDRRDCRAIYTFGYRGTRKIVICDSPARRQVGPPR